MRAVGRNLAELMIYCQTTHMKTRKLCINNFDSSITFKYSKILIPKISLTPKHDSLLLKFHLIQVKNSKAVTTIFLCYK